MELWILGIILIFVCVIVVVLLPCKKNRYECPCKKNLKQ